MSDYAGSRYDQKEEIQILLTKSNPIESPHHKNYLWMARWTKASSSANPQNDSSCNQLEDVNKGSGTNDSGILASRFMKTTVSERLIAGVNHGSASVQRSHRHRSASVQPSHLFSTNMRGQVHDACEELGPMKYEHGDKSFQRRIKQKAVNLHAKIVLSETCSLHKLSELPMDLQKLGSSEIQSSDWNHSPMFKINRKINNILNPKQSSAPGPVSLNVHGYMVHSHRISKKNIDICKTAGGMVSHSEDPAGLSSDPSGIQLIGHLSDTMSCSCSKDNDSSYCQVDEQHTSHYIANSKHELPFASSGKKFHCAQNKNDESDVSALHNQKSRLDVYKQQDAAGDIFRAPVLGTEFCKEATTISYKRDDCCGTFKSHGKASSSLPYKQQQHLSTQRMKSAANINLPDPGANTLKVTSEQRTHGKESTTKCTGSRKRKGPFLYEMLTIASKSKSSSPKNSVSLGDGFDFCMYGTNIGNPLFGTKNQSSAKSDTLILSKSSAGIASSLAQKDYIYSNDTKTEWLPTSRARRDLDSRENESHNVNEHHNGFSKAAIASKQSSMPATGTTNLDPMLFQMRRMRNHISAGVFQPPVSAEPSDRWLKRLHLDISDREVPSSKRPKVVGSPPREGSSCLFSMAHRCNRRGNEELIDLVKEEKVSDEAIKLYHDQRLHVPEKSMNHWIGRWCEGGTPVFYGDRGQRRHETKPDQASEELGGQFPSIAAMAMMGRAMDKPRPYEHQKKGPFVLWKTE